jgi:tetratricopeptide (TPR) repeat protein
MSDSQGPQVTPFTYVHIPAEDASEATEIRFDGASDDELRNRLKRFFAKSTYTEGARAETRKALVEKVEDKASVPSAMLDQLSENDGAFEIVPVVLPSRMNKFRAISLYIDDRGRFKDLPLNYRASAIAQRDIRGDAFLLSNHDDPALDDWARIDTTLETFEELRKNPPKTQLNTGDQAQMMKAASLRDGDTVVVTPEDAEEALALRTRGNSAVAEGDFTQAAAMYAAATEKLRGRTDLLPNADELNTARTACLLNLAHCGIKLARWQMAAGAAAQALIFAPSNPKGWFRLATAQVQMKDFDEADKSIARCVEAGVPAEDVTMLRTQSQAGRAELERDERRRFKKMFESD